MDSTPPATAQPHDEPTRPARLVPAHVAEAKFRSQLERWHANADTYTRRGWVLLRTNDLTVEVGFLHNVAMGARTIPVMTACIRLDYWNFDLWPPSLTFLDPVTREPAPPPVRAPDRVSDSEVRDALIDQHPQTLQPFLCLPGIREYHNHPQHSGDDWLLHRHLREGDLVVICERIWRRMARNVLGMSVAIQSLAPLGAQISTQLDISLLQGDADLAQRQLSRQGAEKNEPSQQAHAQQPPSQRPQGSEPQPGSEQQSPPENSVPAGEHGTSPAAEPTTPTEPSTTTTTPTEPSTTTPASHGDAHDLPARDGLAATHLETALTSTADEPATHPTTQ